MKVEVENGKSGNRSKNGNWNLEEVEMEFGKSENRSIPDSNFLLFTLILSEQYIFFVTLLMLNFFFFFETVFLPFNLENNRFVKARELFVWYIVA